MSESTQLAVTGPKASDQLAVFLGIEKGMMLETLKVQCFKGKRPDEVSDAQLAAFVSTANILQVNPLVPGMLYAYPERNGGITPILGPDGVFKKLDEFIASGKLSGFECEVHMGTDGKPERAEATIHRAEGQKPAKYTAYFSEWSVTSNPNWQARPRHMLWTRAIKQAARQVIHGLPMDSDEYEIAQMHNVTPEPDKPAEARPEPPAPKKRRGTSAPEVVVEATPVPEAPKAEPVAEPVKEAAKTEPANPQSFAEAAAVTPAPTEAPKPRAFLNDKEEIETIVRVKAATAIGIKREGVVHPSIQATLSEGFVGTAYHVGGGTELSPPEKDAAGNVTKPGAYALKAPWALDAELRVTLQGKHNPHPKVNKVQVFVVKVEPVKAKPAEDEGDVF